MSTIEDYDLVVIGSGAADKLLAWTLASGGGGVVPLMCMLRHRRLSDHRVPAALLYSCRTREDVIYHEELGEIAQGDTAFTLRLTLIRQRPPGWSGALGRIDLPMTRALLERLGGMADCFVGGRYGFVEATSVLLMQAGQPMEVIRTERFGATGPLPH
jgi:ferredoxin-NADP reductase